MFMFNSNEPIKAVSPSKISQSLLNGTFVMEMVSNSFSESKKNFWSFDKAEKVLIGKNKDTKIYFH